MIQALIFDFDGLMLNTEVPDYQSWVEIYEEHGCQLPLSIWSAYVGGDGLSFNAYAHLETLYGQSIERDTVRVRRRKRYAELVASQPLLPG